MKKHQANSLRRILLPLLLGLLLKVELQAQDRSLEIEVHRGANNLAPENTMASTLKCIELGTDYVEVDVRMSRDSVLYVLHDRTLDRTTNGTGPISEAYSNDIDQLDAGSWFHSSFTGERVPRLRSLLAEVKGKTKIYFDVKHADLRKLIALVYEAGFEQDSFFWFGDDKQAAQFRELNNEMRLKMNARNLSELETALSYKPDIVECAIEDLSREFIDRCRTLNLKIMIYGKDSKKAYRKVIRSEADMINLNKPELMLKLLNRDGQ